jgi:hypothetical protein
MYDDDESFIDYLILNGALEVVGIEDGTGEMLYGFTEKLMEVDPKLHSKFVNHFHDDIMHLWENGFVSMDVTELNPLVTVTEKAFDEIAVATLSEYQRGTLMSIIKKMMD